MCALPVTLGRDGKVASVVLDDRDVSRRHARLDAAGDALLVTDLGSTNGTFAGEERVTRRTLGPGDVLRIGRYDIRWLFVDPDATAFIDPGERTSLQPVGPPTIPARTVVDNAEAHNRRVGHELDGFLSLAHGFLPVEPPLTAFPESHRAWDDMTGRLPELFRRLALRRAFDALPVLDARPEALPDRYLLRASTLLGVYAHAYQYMAVDPPTALPESLLRPWTTVSRRLGKAQPAVSYIDLFFYNWRLRDPSGPRVLDNLELLVPTWDNAAERVFYLVTTEFAMGLTPVLGAMLDAQEAVVAEDPARLSVRCWSSSAACATSPRPSTRRSTPTRAAATHLTRCCGPRPSAPRAYRSSTAPRAPAAPRSRTSMPSTRSWNGVTSARWSASRACTSPVSSRGTGGSWWRRCVRCRCASTSNGPATRRCAASTTRSWTRTPATGAGWGCTGSRRTASSRWRSRSAARSRPVPGSRDCSRTARGTGSTSSWRWSATSGAHRSDRRWCSAPLAAAGSSPPTAARGPATWSST
ncbi:FHA domain-containing protein [Dactylosporangium cerinum]